MRYSDGYKENTYLTWKGEKYRVTPEFESLSFYDERDGDVSLYCISLTDDWHKEELYPCWDAFAVLTVLCRKAWLNNGFVTMKAGAAVLNTETDASNTTAGTLRTFPYWTYSLNAWTNLRLLC